MIAPKYRWLAPPRIEPDPGWPALAARFGVSDRLLRILAGRGLAAGELAGFLGEPGAQLHDATSLPDAGAALRRVLEARARGERVLVYGDFDADGLTGLAILVLALRAVGIDASPYVPDRLGDGHGLSQRAIDRAIAEGRTLVVTADCGTSSGPEIAAARSLGIETVVTDHHHASTWPGAAAAVVNPHRADSAYPDQRLTGAGVAWKFAGLILAASGAPADAHLGLADLALIGTVADVAPAIGENRAIAKLGLERLRTAPRPGIAALLRAAGVAPAAVDLDTIGFVVAPRLNAAGRVGDAERAARLLLAEDGAEADALATELEGANHDRRDMTASALAEATAVLAGLSAEAALPPAIVVRGDWPVGIVGLVAGRLVEEHRRPAIVATVVDPEAGVLRASCRSPRGFNLAAALIECEDLLIRHGGHAAAAGFEVADACWPAFEARFLGLVAARAQPDAHPELPVDLVLPASAIDYALVRELRLLEPTGPGNPAPVIAATGLTVTRVRAANGGHTQLVLKRERDVLDAIAFRRADLAVGLQEGDRVDVAAHVASRRFGGFESMQLEILDVAPAGYAAGCEASEAPVTGSGGARRPFVR